MESSLRPGSAFSSTSHGNHRPLLRPDSALSHASQSHGLLRPGSALSNNAGPLSHSRPPTAMSSICFRPASAAGSYTSSKLRDERASLYSPTPSQLLYDCNPPVGIFRKQLMRNSWFLANQRAPSETRAGKPICKEIPLPLSVTMGQLDPKTIMSRPGSSALRVQSGASHRGSAHDGGRRLGRLQSALSRGSTSQKLRSEVSAARPQAPFGTLEEDHVSIVNDLTSWAPAVHGAKPESLPSHYRTTTKHGSTSHTIWEFVWEKPVVRDARINQEIKLQEEWEM